MNPALTSSVRSSPGQIWNDSGLSVHQAAAPLARRLLGCSERIPRWRSCLSDNGHHVAFTSSCKEARKQRMDVLGCDFRAN